MMNLCFAICFLSPALKFHVDRNAFVCYHTNML
ncbi:Uncharacterised protein [uncultured Blautia sp.]|nr:Uncharacterised protein [uncultured Blautia sp.]